MAAGRPLLGLLGLLLTAGALLLMFLTLLGGANNHRPLNEIYFLQAHTANIPGAPTESRWTFWSLCRVNVRGHNVCGSSHPAFPLDPPSHRNFNTRTNIPHSFIGTNHYFLMTRFMFAFILIALFFAVLSLFLGLLALCTRIGSFLSALLGLIALTFQTITTALMTAAYVQGRNDFNRNGQRSHLGVKAFAFMWTATVCLFLASLLYCIGGTIRKDKGYSGREQRRRGFFGPRRSGSTREYADSRDFADGAGRKETAV
ncbi:Eisosomes component [Paecilomyces lecythidis]|uniref:Eisosomes component n=1 Tax=Paecilomyces lecythidis TaxID=3004212 RepID=A0ABR3YE91_9EURO